MGTVSGFPSSLLYMDLSNALCCYMTFLRRFIMHSKQLTYSSKTASDKLVKVPTVRLQQRRQRSSSPACRRVTKPLIVCYTKERVSSNSLRLAQFKIGDVKRKETTWQSVTLQNRNPAPLSELLTSPKHTRVTVSRDPSWKVGVTHGGGGEFP